MEHRWSARMSVDGVVSVHCAVHGAIRAELIDISLGGMFIDTGVRTLPVNAPVVLSFSLNRSDEVSHFRLQAMAVRIVAEGGVGLMYLDHDPETIRALREALYDRPVTSTLENGSGDERLPADRREARRTQVVESGKGDDTSFGTAM